MSEKSAGASPSAVKLQKQRGVCAVCGKASNEMICRACADKVQAEAVSRKKRADKGQE